MSSRSTKVADIPRDARVYNLASGSLWTARGSHLRVDELDGTMSASGPSELAPSEARTNVFVSYSRKDVAFVDRLATGLEAHAIAPKIDRAEIYSFEDWWTRLQVLIGEADTVIFVLSPDAIASDVCRKEVDYAHSLHKRFAPIVCRPVAAHLDQIPAALAQLNFVFFDDSQSFESALAKLVDALTTDIGWVRKHTQYGRDAHAWAQSGRPSGLLLRSPRLDDAETWIATRPTGAPQPSDETRAFLLESRRGATRRRNSLTGSLAAGLVIAVVLGGLAFWQRGQAVEQRAIAEAQTTRAIAQEAIAKAATTRAETELAAEQVARKEATAQRDRAEKLLTASTDTAQSLVSDLAIKFNQTRGISLDIIQGILDKAKGLLDQLESFHENTPALKLGRIRTDTELGFTLAQAGSPEGAGDVTRAYATVAKLMTSQPRLEGLDYVHGRAAEVLGQLTERGDARKAIGFYEEAADAYAKCADRPDGLDCLLREVQAAGHVGNVLFDLRQYKDALDVYRHSRDLAQDYQRRAPPGIAVDLVLGQRYNHLGDVDYMLKDTEGARQDYTTVISFLAPWQAKPDANTTLSAELANAYNGVALVLGDDAARLRDRGKVKEALDYTQKDVGLLEALAVADPANLFYWSNLARADDNAAFLSQILGDRIGVAMYNQKRDYAMARAKGGKTP